MLGFFREIVRTNERGQLFAPRMIVRKSDRMSVGSIGITSPDEDGYAMIGYSVYPDFEGNGFASEAAKTLVEYGLAMEGLLESTRRFTPVTLARRSSRAGRVWFSLARSELKTMSG